MARMSIVHLVRHGDTPQAVQGYLAGDIDPPLTDGGRAQATAVGRLAGSLGIKALYVSPKMRARMTAAPIVEACGVDPTVDDGLREIAYGSWEGRKESDVEATEPEAYAAWSTDPGLFGPPGGETAFAVAARALPVVERARREHPNAPVMVVSHKATIRILVCALLGVPVGRFRDRFACPTASLTTIEFGARGAMLVRVGDVHHLSA
jgi:broad specificity phosphatase PhoE